MNRGTSREESGRLIRYLAAARLWRKRNRYITASEFRYKIVCVPFDCLICGYKVILLFYKTSEYLVLLDSTVSMVILFVSSKIF